MIFLNPAWLLLTIPVFAAFLLLKQSSRLIRVLRAVTLSLVLLAAAGLCLRVPGRDGTVVVIADRSSSMPRDSASNQKEIIDLIQSEMEFADSLAVVSFGRQIAIEMSPQNRAFSGFTAEVGQDASNLAGALETAVSLIGKDSTGRIIIISDGKWTGQNPSSAAMTAVARNIPIDYRMLERSQTNDLAIFRIDTPNTTAPGETFMISAWIKSPIKQDISFNLKRRNHVIVSGKKTVSAGLTRLTFSDRAPDTGAVQYHLIISSPNNDPVPENNTGGFLVGTAGMKPVLLVSNSRNSMLAGLLRTGGLDVHAFSPESFNWTIEELTGYSSLLIEDVSANRIGVSAMENIAAWVTHTGAGLMMTGGKNSYALGGYYKSPLEPVMPVSMEMRKEHRKMSLAIVVVLDRSGSMVTPVAGGKTKMDLANIASAQVLDMLSPGDEFGVIAVDSIPHTIVSLAPVEINIENKKKILRIDSSGGGIFIFEALSSAAAMLSASAAQTRHIILFADAADSEKPGQYKDLLKKCVKAGMTVSVIGLGKPTDPDAKLLQDIAVRGKGRSFFTDNPMELPRLFAQDTFVVARSSFLEEPVSIKTTAAMNTLFGSQPKISHKIGGYNLCYLRSDAELAMVSVDEYKAPVVAAWHTGAGRALSFAAQANGKFTGEIAKWQGFGDLLTSLVRWVAGKKSNLGENMLLTQRVENGICLIQLHLDPERVHNELTELPELTTLHGEPGQPPAISRTVMQFEDADTVYAEIPLTGTEAYLSIFNAPGFNPVTLPPVSLPYSPEFKPGQSENNSATLEQLAKLTGGRERINLADIWKDIPRKPQTIPAGKWLLSLAIIFLLLEILERRTGLLSSLRWSMLIEKLYKRLKSVRQTSGTGTDALESSRQADIKRKKKQPAPAAAVKTDEVSESDLLSAFAKARETANKRTQKKR